MGSFLDDVAKALEERTLAPPPKMEDLIWLLYGDKKAGKSTTASRFPDPIFLDFEDGLRSTILQSGERPAQKSIKHWYKRDGEEPFSSVESWMEFFATGEQLPYKTLVIDGLNEGYELLRNDILLRHNVEHENQGDLSYGKGKGIINREWRRWFSELRRLPYGVVLTAHSRPRSFEHNGVSYDKNVPLVDGGKAEEAYDAMKPSIDAIVYIKKVDTKNGAQHLMYTKGTNLFEAADPTPNGRLPNGVPLSYAALENAYYNKG